jgi:hypothetical protein
VNSKMSWYTRVGALAVLLGFVFPSMVVSCSPVPLAAASQSFSLLTLADALNISSLYLVPAAIIGILILSIIPQTNSLEALRYFWLQVGAAIVSLITLLGVFISLSNQIAQSGVFKLTPEYGLFFLVGGYISIGIGLYGEKQHLGYQQQLIPPEYKIPKVSQQATTDIEEISGSLTGGAVLQLINGIAPKKIYALWDNFTIGRSSTNQMILSEPLTSRSHAGIRYHEGNWFIQDLDSSGGTFVNGTQVMAIKLNSGDQITIGDSTFLFKTT